MYLLSGVRMDSAIILDVSVKDLIGSVPSPAQKPSIIPHFKFRLLCEAFRGLAPTHLRLPLVQPYTDLTELSTRFLYHVPFLTLQCLQCRRAADPSPGLLGAFSKPHLRSVKLSLLSLQDPLHQPMSVPFTEALISLSAVRPTFMCQLLALAT